MTILLVPVLAGQVNAATYFDRSFAAHKALNATSVTIRVEGQFGGQKLSNVYRVAYIRPNRASVRVTEKGADRSYYVVGNKFSGFDRTNNEYLTRPAPVKATLLDRLGLALSTIDESVQPILELSVLDGLYIKFRGTKGWTKTEDAKTIRLLRYVGPEKDRVGAAFFFDKKTYLLKGATFMGGPSNVMAWRYEYGAKPKDISFRPPATALKVSSFLETRPQPSYADPIARRVAEASARAYDSLRHVELVVASSAGKHRIWMSSGRVRERQGNIDWSYANGWLTVLNLKKNRVYKGKTPYAQVPNYLQKLGLRMDPIIRQLGQRKNPMRVMLHERAKVRRIGAITDRGAMCDILQLEDSKLRVSVWVRQKDRLLQSVETRHLDENGKTVLSSTRDFQYMSLGKPLAQTVFQVGGKRKPLQLSQIGK